MSQKHKGTVESLRKDRKAVKLTPAGPNGEWFSWPQGQTVPQEVDRGTVLGVVFTVTQGKDGRYWQNVTNHKVLAQGPAPRAAGGGGGGGGGSQQDSIERQTCLKAAAEIHSGLADVPPPAAVVRYAQVLLDWVQGRETTEVLVESGAEAPNDGWGGDDDEFNDDIPF